MGQKSEWARKLGRPNTKLGEPVPGRPTRTLVLTIILIQFSIVFII